MTRREVEPLERVRETGRIIGGMIGESMLSSGRRMRVKGALAAAAVVLGGCQSAATMRPYRLTVLAPPASATERLASAMGTDAELKPAWVDPSRGIAVGPWRFYGVTSNVTVLPPGEEHRWLVMRYRVIVQPADPAWSTSFAFVDREQLSCDPNGFRWDALNVWGSCTPTTDVYPADQGAIDGKGLELGSRIGGR